MIAFPPSDNRLWVNTPHGLGLVYCIEFVENDNYVWTVIIQENGMIRHYDTLQLTAAIQHTAEINLNNIKPIFPSNPKR